MPFAAFFGLASGLFIDYPDLIEELRAYRPRPASFPVVLQEQDKFDFVDECHSSSPAVNNRQDRAALPKEQSTQSGGQGKLEPEKPGRKDGNHSDRRAGSNIAPVAPPPKETGGRRFVDPTGEGLDLSVYMTHSDALFDGLNLDFNCDNLSDDGQSDSGYATNHGMEKL